MTKDTVTLGLATAALLCGCGVRMCAQGPATQQAPPVQSTSKATVSQRGNVDTSASAVSRGNELPAGKGVLVDQVIAVVNGDLILESDVDEDKRFQAFQPYTNPDNSFTRQGTIERLIDRTLILQQAKLQPDSGVTDAEAQAQLQTLRKEIPACKPYHCETDAGWAKFVNAQGFTLDELNDKWKQKMQVLKFIEIRFRSGIEITPAQIKEYYDQKLLPEYAKRNATAPKLAVISDRIQEILLQQQVSSLLADWLQSLKAQGNVRVMAPGEGL